MVINVMGFLIMIRKTYLISLQHESQKSVHVKGHKDAIPSKVVEERVGPTTPLTCY